VQIFKQMRFQGLLGNFSQIFGRNDFIRIDNISIYKGRQAAKILDLFTLFALFINRGIDGGP